jgi:hypothetical protein
VATFNTLHNSGEVFNLRLPDPEDEGTTILSNTGVTCLTECQITDDLNLEILFGFTQNFRLILSSKNLPSMFTDHTQMEVNNGNFSVGKVIVPYLKPFY